MSEKGEWKQVFAYDYQKLKELFDSLVTPPVPKNGKWTIRQLVYLTFPEFWALWKSLPAPDFFEMNGEYTGYCPDGNDAEVRKRTAEHMFTEGLNLGYWLGKAFAQKSATKGEGYNVYRQPGEWINRYLRFGTEMGTSVWDGKPSFIMHYGQFKNRAGRVDLTDEVRKLDDGIYLGIGHGKTPDGYRSSPGPFVLVGPVRPYIGVEDDSRERS